MSKISDAIKNKTIASESKESFVSCLQTEAKQPIKIDTTCSMVSHPKHYSVNDATYEPYRVIAAWDCDFNIGSAIKYLARFKKKWNPIEDLMKAKQYIDFEIEKIKNEMPNYENNNEKDN